MRRNSLAWRTAALAVTAGVAVVPVGTATAGTAGWQVVSSGKLPSGAKLFGVTASDATHAWAVGSQPADGTTQAAIMRWNGSAWAPSDSSTGVRGKLRKLTAASAASPTDVWAAGTGNDQGPAVVHYTGGRWTQVDTTGMAGSARGVAAVPGKTWVAAGDSVYTRTAHGWQATELADGDNGGHLTAVHARSRTDAWAVGVDHREGTPDDVYKPPRSRVWHWDGTSWTALPPLKIAGTMHDVVALSSDDVWAVGEWFGNLSTVATHWDGTRWTTKAPPSEPGTRGKTGVADRSGRVWIGAQHYDYPDKLTVNRYADGKWTNLHPSAPKGSGDVVINGMTAVPGGGMWAVGGTRQGDLIARHG